jgi:hypothetical protein
MANSHQYDSGDRIDGIIRVALEPLRHPASRAWYLAQLVNELYQLIGDNKYTSEDTRIQARHMLGRCLDGTYYKEAGYLL